NPDNAATYGRLYNWFAVDDSRGLAPEGWHVPSDDEWKQLERYLGMDSTEADNQGWRGTDEGGKLKETGEAHWNSPNEGATNETGFTALPGGYLYPYLSAFFESIGKSAYFWSSTEDPTNEGWYRILDYAVSQIARYSYNKVHGYSVRCVKDSE
ncbi:MAG: fibrobacter succinogenes major paralogous domain-containing protein, partial [Candidatus Zixiibacteriota bacterium]